jgi:hypothetical protein
MLPGCVALIGCRPIKALKIKLFDLDQLSSPQTA